jgi:hypothetical protein
LRSAVDQISRKPERGVGGGRQLLEKTAKRLAATLNVSEGERRCIRAAEAVVCMLRRMVAIDVKSPASSTR